MPIDLKGRNISSSEVMDCQGKRCPVSYCKLKEPASAHRCLGYYEMVDCVGGKRKLFRCEYVKV